jgi:hypothetical protein
MTGALSERPGKAGRKERGLVTAVAVLAVAAVALALAVGILAQAVSRQNTRIAALGQQQQVALEQQQQAGCSDADQARAEAVYVWDQVILPAVIAYRTAAGREKLLKLEAAIGRKFAPQTCR